MARALRVRCSGCDKICNAQPITLELFLTLSKKERELLFNIDAMYVFCQNRNEYIFLDLRR